MSFSTFLYDHSPIVCQNIALSLYGLKLKRLRFGRDYQDYLDFLLLSDRYTKDQLRELQTEYLLKLIRHSAKYVPHYKKIINLHDTQLTHDNIYELFIKLPFLTKDQLRENPNNFLSKYYPKNRLILTKTSGTTGTPLIIFNSKRAIERNYSFYARFLLQHGVNIHAKTATFAGRTVVPISQTSPPYWRYNWAKNQALFSTYHLSQATIPLYIEALENFNPLLIDSYPSPLYLISVFINNNKIKHHIQPQLITTSSEVLTKTQRESIEKAFQCTIADQYGSAEKSSFIAQCEHGRYHAAMEYGIIEVLDNYGKPVKPGESGELICTSFLNYAMPLIRYKTGDSVVVSTEPCPCGRPSQTFDKILGRTNDLIVTKTGKLVSNMHLIFKFVSPIIEAQLVQETIDLININLVAQRRLSSKETDILLTELSNRIGDVKTINFNYFDKLDRTTSGKLQTVISKVNHELLGTSNQSNASN